MLKLPVFQGANRNPDQKNNLKITERRILYQTILRPFLCYINLDKETIVFKNIPLIQKKSGIQLHFILLKRLYHY
jgi:hypothetical protein